MDRKSAGRFITNLFSVAAFVSVLTGVVYAYRSQLFEVQVVEVEEPHQGMPVDADTVSRLSGVRSGESHLLKLNLQGVATQLKQNPWIQSVDLQKKFPQTLSIKVSLKQPRAILHTDSGVLRYLDTDGKPFAVVNGMVGSDLPVLSGFNSDDARIFTALKLIDLWKERQQGVSQLLGVTLDPERGYRVLVSYRLNVGNSLGASESRWIRTYVDLGHEPDEVDQQIVRLAKVFEYLQEKSIAVRHIFADSGKKIVVKILHSS